MDTAIFAVEEYHPLASPAAPFAETDRQMGVTYILVSEYAWAM